MVDLIGMSNAAWKRQPRGRVTVQPLYSSIVDVALMGGQRSFVKGGAYSDTGVTFGAGPAGLSHNSDETNYINDAGYRGRALPLTYVFLFSSTATTIGCVAGEIDNISLYIERITINSADTDYTSTGYVSMTMRLMYGNLHIIQSASALTINDGRPHCIVFSMRKQASGSNSVLFMDGKPIPTSINYQSGDFNYDQTGVMEYPLFIMSQNARAVPSKTCPAGVKLYCFARLLTYLDDRLLLDLSANPWQLFTPAPSRFYLIPSGGGATTHDVALILAYTAAFQPTATAQFNAGITLATLAGALSGKNAQFNTALTLDTNVSVTLQRALSALASVQLDMTAAQSVSALNAAVAAITESISCSYTSSVTAHLLASLSFGITQAMISGTGSQLAAALALALNAGTQASTTATYAADLTLLTTLQAALQATLATTANLTLPATLTLTLDGERLTDGDVALALNVQTGISTSATALLSAQLTLATQLLATPAGVASFQAALTLAQQIGTLFSTGNTLTSSLSFAVSMALADSAALSLGGSLELGTVLSQVQSALASFQAGVTFPTTLTLPITGGLAMEDGISLGWTLGTNIDGAFFEMTVTLPTGRVIVLAASERLLSISASERLITIPHP